MSMHTHSCSLVLGSALAAIMLAACDRAPDTQSKAPTAERPSVGAKIDGAVDRTKEVVGDAAITAKVKSKFIADAELKAIQIDVDTINGAVTLRGSVASPLAKDRATTVAREVEGVRSVDNQLVVSSS